MTLVLVQDISRLWRQPVDSTAGIYECTSGAPTGYTHCIAWGDSIPPPNTSFDPNYVVQFQLPNYDTQAVQATPPPRGISWFQNLGDAQRHASQAGEL